MRRTLIILVIVVVVASLTTSAAVSATRINRLVFNAVTSVDDGTLATKAGDAAAMASQAEAASTGRRTKNGRCAGECVGLFLQAEGRLGGVASTDVLTVVIAASGVASGTCDNPGGNMPPGQNPPAQTVNVTSSGQQQIDGPEITAKGKADISITVGLPSYSLPGTQLGCPNDHWTATITSIQFVSVTVSVFEGESLLVEQTYTF